MNPSQVPPFLTPLYTRKDISRHVQKLAQALSQSFAGQEPIVIGVLKGALLFVADLVREMTIPVKVDFVQVASYGSSMESASTTRLLKDLSLDIEGQDVILVDTVLDTGLTLRFLLDLLNQRRPRSVAVCILIDKRQRRQVEVVVNHVGFILSEGFVVGYGLDCGESYRNLDGIYLVKGSPLPYSGP